MLKIMKAKKRLVPAVLFTVILLQIFSVSVSAQLGLVYEAPQGTPTIDAEAEALWDNAPWTEMTVYNQSYEPIDGVSLRQKVMWDADNVYYLFELTCPDFNDEVDPTAGGAEVEIFLDELLCREASTRSDDRQTLVSFAGGIGEWGVEDEDGNPNGRVDLTTAKAKKTATGALLEVAMKFSTIKGELGKELGLEFMLDFKSADDSERTVIRWNCEPDEDGTAPYQGTEYWGTLKLVAAPAAAEPEPEPEPEAPPAEVPATDAPPADEPAPDVSVPSAPRVGDNALMLFGSLIVLSVAVLVLRKKANH